MQQALPAFYARRELPAHYPHTPQEQFPLLPQHQEKQAILSFLNPNRSSLQVYGDLMKILNRSKRRAEDRPDPETGMKRIFWIDGILTAKILQGMRRRASPSFLTTCSPISRK